MFKFMERFKHGGTDVLDLFYKNKANLLTLFEEVKGEMGELH